MAHLRIAQRGQAVGGDAAPDPPLPGGRVGLEVLRQHAPQRRERGLHGRRLGDGTWAATHASTRSTSASNRASASACAAGSPQSISSAALRLGAPSSVTPAPRRTCSRGIFNVVAAHVTTVAQRAAQQIPRIFHAARAHQRRGIQRRAQRLPAEAAGLFRQRHGAIEQLPIEVVRDHALAKLHQRALRERRVGRAQTPQHQLPALVQARGHHRFRIADLVVGLQHGHHRQERRRQRRGPARLIRRRQLRLERLVEELGADRRARTRRTCRCGAASPPRALPQDSARSEPASEWVWACAHQITGRSPSRSPCAGRATFALAGGAGRGRPARAAGATPVTRAFGAEHGWGCPATGPATRMSSPLR